MSNIVTLLACPDCRLALKKTAGRLVCPNQHTFRRGVDTALNLLPTAPRQSREWQIWEAKQAEGLKNYTAGDNHYHEISDNIAKLFGTFANFHGTILDIGCGIHGRLAYVPDDTYHHVTYIGLDPLPATEAMPFCFVRGLAEQLPFKNQVFDQIVLATSLDHLIDLPPVFDEIRRVVKPNGDIVVWSTVIEYIPAADIRLLDWLKDVAYLLAHGQLQRALRRFLLPYPVAGLEYQPTDRYHFHRFTRRSIQEAFARAGWQVAEAWYLEDPLNLGSKHLFARLRDAT